MSGKRSTQPTKQYVEFLDAWLPSSGKKHVKVSLAVLHLENDAYGFDLFSGQGAKRKLLNEGLTFECVSEEETDLYSFTSKSPSNDGLSIFIKDQQQKKDKYLQTTVPLDSMEISTPTNRKAHSKPHRKGSSSPGHSLHVLPKRASFNGTSILSDNGNSKRSRVVPDDEEEEDPSGENDNRCEGMEETNVHEHLRTKTAKKARRIHSIDENEYLSQWRSNPNRASSTAASEFEASEESIKYNNTFEIILRRNLQTSFQALGALKGQMAVEQAQATLKAVFAPTTETLRDLREAFVVHLADRFWSYEPRQAKSQLVKAILGRAMELIPETCQTRFVGNLLLNVLKDRFLCKRFTMSDLVPAWKPSPSVCTKHLFGVPSEIALDVSGDERVGSKRNFLGVLIAAAQGDMDNLPRSIVMWATSVNDDNFQEFPILNFTNGQVASTDGDFKGVKEPSSFLEWVSLLYYVVLWHFVHKSNIGSVVTGSISLRERSGIAINNMMSEKGMPLKKLIENVFLLSSGPEAALWCGGYFRMAFKLNENHCTSPLVGTIRLFLLLSRYVLINYKLIAENPELTSMILSVRRLVPLSDQDWNDNDLPNEAKKMKSTMCLGGMKFKEYIA